MVRCAFAIGLAACGAATAPPPAVTPPPATPSWTAPPLTIAGTVPIAAIDVRLESIPDERLERLDRAFLIRSDVTVRGAVEPRALVHMDVRCRVADQNLVVADSFGDLGDDLTGPTTRVVQDLFQLPDAPTACEVTYLYRHRSDPKDDLAVAIAFDRNPANAKVAAAVCIRDRGFTDGACPRDTFPPPRLPAGFTIGLSRASYSIDAGSDLRLAGFTWAESSSPSRSYEVSFRCEDGAEGRASLADLTDTWSARVPAGSTAAATIGIAAYPSITDDPGRCELAIVSHANDDPKARAQVHGTYCLASGAANPGACRPALAIRARPPADADELGSDEAKYKMHP